MLNLIYQLCITWIYLPLLSVVKIIERNPNSLYVLIAIFIVLVVAKSKIKVPFLPKIVDILTIVAILLLALVIYSQFGSTILSFFKQGSPSQTPSSSSSNPSTKTKPTTPSTPTTPPKKQTPPSYQTPKQLYYTVSCYSCWNEVCPNNGYSYGGYDSSYYSYYYGLCKSCECNDFKAISFWK